MQIKIFTVSVFSDDKDLEELNLFLRSNKIIDVRRELSQVNDNCCWTFCVSYMPSNYPDREMGKSHSRAEKIDYMKVLDSDTFNRFAQMRKLRKKISEDEGEPCICCFFGC